MEMKIRLLNYTNQEVFTSNFISRTNLLTRSIYMIIYSINMIGIIGIIFLNILNLIGVGNIGSCSDVIL